MINILKKIWNGLQWACAIIMMTAAFIVMIGVPIYIVVSVAQHGGIMWAMLVVVAIVIFVIGYVKMLKWSNANK